MTTKIVIQFSGVNLSQVVAEEMSQQLLKLPSEADIFHLEPPREQDLLTTPQMSENATEVTLGKRRTWAAFDWTIISSVADIIGIASFLWLIYEKIIISRRSEDQVHDNYTIVGQNKGLYISIDPERGLHWFLGKDFTEYEVFIKDVEVKVSKYQQIDEAERRFDTIATDIKFSGTWVQKNRM